MIGYCFVVSQHPTLEKYIDIPFLIGIDKVPTQFDVGSLIQVR
jgi:hypothetical protein